MKNMNRHVDQMLEMIIRDLDRRSFKTWSPLDDLLQDLDEKSPARTRL